MAWISLGKFEREKAFERQYSFICWLAPYFGIDKTNK